MSSKVSLCGNFPASIFAGLAGLLLLIGTSAGAETTSIMGMKLESLEREADRIIVTTTGARFVLKDDGVLECWQRIGAQRLVTKLHFPPERFPLAVAPEIDRKRTWAWIEEDGFTCRILGCGVRLRISGDSLMVISFDSETPLRVEGCFTPAYHASTEGKAQLNELTEPIPGEASELEGKWLILDEQGGFGFYPVTDKKVEPPQFDQARWSIGYEFTPREEAWLCVCPPRPYDWKRSFESLAHEGWREKPSDAYPDERTIRLDSVNCKIFAVHSYFWPGGEQAPWYIRDFLPMDMDAFVHMRDQVHDRGMKLVVYFSPFYASVPDFFGQVRRALDELKVDGLYYDGISMDFRKSYELVRKTRHMLGDHRILYLHTSADPFGSCRLYCPFIDAYADYVLRGEAQRGGLDRDTFLRWVVSGYQISNTVGIWLSYGSTGESSEYIHVPPSTDDIEATLANHARLWLTRNSWENPALFKGGRKLTRQECVDLVEDFERDYYGKLGELEKSYDSNNHSER